MKIPIFAIIVIFCVFIDFLAYYFKNIIDCKIAEKLTKALKITQIVKCC